ncbi:hypothetical protein ABTW24_20540 [Sphingobacterium thalpophilum]|uniref:N-acetylneuraminate epimerase n=1 Tax=Sphingobacterium thalpophilum TaxID=259 RepID=A0ABV4HJ52_9SPHI
MTKQNWMTIVAGILMVSSVYGQTGRLEWHRSIDLPARQNGKAHIGLAGPIAGLAKDFLLIGGGANFPDLPPWEGGKKKIQKDVYIYAKDSAGLSLIGQDSLPDAVAYSASLSVANGLCVIGGENTEGKTNACRLIRYDVSNRKIETFVYPQLPFSLSNMGAVCLGNKLLVAGGERHDGVSDQVLQLDLEDLGSGWKKVGTLPYPVSHLQLLVDDMHHLYVVGGRKGNRSAASTLYQGLLKSVDGGQRWLELTDIPFKAAAGTACVLPDHGLWLFSADRGTTFHRVETILSEAEKEPDTEKKQELIRAKNMLQANHPGFGREIWRYDLKSGRWSRAGDLPSNGPVTTTAVLWGDMLVLPSGEIKAGVRSAQILLATFFKK